jgi:hypothetical protein
MGIMAESSPKTAEGEGARSEGKGLRQRMRMMAWSIDLAIFSGDIRTLIA